MKNVRKTKITEQKYLHKRYHRKNWNENLQNKSKLIKRKKENLSKR